MSTKLLKVLHKLYMFTFICKHWELVRLDSLLPSFVFYPHSRLHSNLSPLQKPKSVHNILHLFLTPMLLKKIIIMQQRLDSNGNSTSIILFQSSLRGNISKVLKTLHFHNLTIEFNKVVWVLNFLRHEERQRNNKHISTC